MIAAMRTGRPSSFTPEIATAICERIADGQSMRTICADDDMPAMKTVFRWLAHVERDDFRQQYAHARAAQAEHMAEEILAIADDGSNDWMKSNHPDNPGYACNGEAIARSRLRVDSRKWLASKLLPKKYGDVSRHEHSGPEGKPIETRTVLELSDEDLARIAGGGK